MGSEPERMADRYEKTSPWPIVVVFGLVLSEIGVLFNVYPVAVAGLVMFVGSISGIVHEAGYVTSPWGLVVGLGIALAILGFILISIRVDGVIPVSVLESAAADDVVQRGLTIGATGVVLSLAGLVLPRVLDR